MSRMQELKKLASLLLRLLFQEFAQGLFRVSGNNQTLFFRPALLSLFGLPSGFVSHRSNGKLNRFVWGYESAPGGARTRKTGSVTRLQTGPVCQFQHGGTNAEYGGEGLLDSRLAPTWFGHLSLPLTPPHRSSLPRRLAETIQYHRFENLL
jgi:hypothetical protein